MDIDASLVSRLIFTGTVDKAVAAGIRPDQFEDPQMSLVYEMAMNYYRTFNTSPSLEWTKMRFPDLQFRPVTDDVGALIYEFKQVSGMREVITAWQDIGLEIDRATDGDLTTRAELPERLMEIARHVLAKTAKDQMSRLSQMDERAAIAKERQDLGIVPGIKTPHRAIDPYVPAFKPTQYVVFCAASGIGKTTGLVRAGIEAFEDGKTVTMVSLEMDEDEVWEMFDARHAQISRKALERLQLGEDDYARYQEKAARLKEARNDVFVTAPPIVTIDHLAGYIEQTNPDMLLVDYVSLLKPLLKTTDSWQAVADVSVGLKQLARQYKIVVCAAAQNSKDAVEVGPTETNIAFSKTIHNDCNVMIGYHQDPAMAREKKVQCRLIKNRRGDKGPPGASGYFEFEEYWDRDRMVFEDWSPARHAYAAKAGLGAV